MSETTTTHAPERIRELEARELHLMDIYAALGVQLGDDPFTRIREMQRTDAVIRGAIAIVAALEPGEDEPITAAAARLRTERDEATAKYDSACQTIAAMHAAAVGEVRGPIRGVVEDVADVAAQLATARATIALNRNRWRVLTVGDLIAVFRLMVETDPQATADDHAMMASLEQALLGSAAESGTGTGSGQ